MSQSTSRAVAEIVFSSFLAFLAVIALLDLRGLQKTQFDYLGSADLPFWLAWITIALSLAVALKAAAGLLRSAAPGEETAPRSGSAESATPWVGGRRQIAQVSTVALGTLAYVATIVWSLLPYSVSTALFLITGISVLAPPGRRRWGIILVLAIGVGAAGEYLFAQILAMPFPRF